MRQFLILPLLFALVRSAVTESFTGPGGNPPPPKGFVTTKGSSFELDGKPFVRESHRGISYAVVLTNNICISVFCWGQFLCERFAHLNALALSNQIFGGSGFLYSPPQMMWKVLSSRCKMQV
jgi:hypothetical protein